MTWRQHANGLPFQRSRKVEMECAVCGETASGQTKPGAWNSHESRLSREVALALEGLWRRACLSKYEMVAREACNYIRNAYQRHRVALLLPLMCLLPAPLPYTRALGPTPISRSSTCFTTSRLLSSSVHRSISLTGLHIELPQATDTLRLTSQMIRAGFRKPAAKSDAAPDSSVTLSASKQRNGASLTTKCQPLPTGIAVTY